MKHRILIFYPISVTDLLPGLWQSITAQKVRRICWHMSIQNLNTISSRPWTRTCRTGSLHDSSVQTAVMSSTCGIRIFCCFKIVKVNLASNAKCTYGRMQYLKIIPESSSDAFIADNSFPILILAELLSCYNFAFFL